MYLLKIVDESFASQGFYWPGCIALTAKKADQRKFSVRYVIHLGNQDLIQFEVVQYQEFT